MIAGQPSRSSTVTSQPACHASRYSSNCAPASGATGSTVMPSRGVTVHARGSIAMPRMCHDSNPLAASRSPRSAGSVSGCTHHLNGTPSARYSAIVRSITASASTPGTRDSTTSLPTVDFDDGLIVWYQPSRSITCMSGESNTEPTGASATSTIFASRSTAEPYTNETSAARSKQTALARTKPAVLVTDLEARGGLRLHLHLGRLDLHLRRLDLDAGARLDRAVDLRPTFAPAFTAVSR